MGQSYGAGLWGRTWGGMRATGLSVMSQEQHYGAALWGRTWGEGCAMGQDVGQADVLWGSA